MISQRIIIVGGGAAGFFAAITCAEGDPSAQVTLIEKGQKFLTKVRISGGGRCNVTHQCFDARDLSTRFPRGSQELIGAFNRFQPGDAIAWFGERGVELKVEADGRMFPSTDTSQTIVDALIQAASNAGVKLRLECGVDSVTKQVDGGFRLGLSDGKTIECDRLLLATGGCRSSAGGQLAVSLGHNLTALAPSLFTVHIDEKWLRELPGVSIENIEATVPGMRLRERGPMLITHVGLSGPVILRLSAWGARELAAVDYKFPLHINWLPQYTNESLSSKLSRLRKTHPSRMIVNSPLAPLSARLWEQLVIASGLSPSIRWAELSGSAQHDLVNHLLRTEFVVTGKTLNKEEFVTCGGVTLAEVNFKTMESRICPRLYFAGELLDIDGITGGFNFQSCWTTGWIAGNAMAGLLGD